MERRAILGRLTWQFGEVIATREENARTRSLILSVPQWQGHQAGQHVDIRLTAEDGYQAERSYSIASPPEEKQHLMLTVERLKDGEVSPYLVDDVRVGDKLELRGPIGGYFVWDVAMKDPLLLVGGGSGVVPLMAMIRHSLAAGTHVPTRLFVSSRSYDDIIYRDELDDVSKQEQNITIYHSLTRTQPTGWTGYSRRIDVNLLRELIWPVQEHPLAFICGPTQFVETAASGLLSLGYEASRIKTERFGPTGGS